MNGSAELHTLTGAYALHALDADERTAFERHLRHCAPCAAEVAEFAATAARLGLAVADAPRPELREQVLRRVSEVRQDPPRAAGPVVGARLSRALRGAGRWALAACVAAAAGLGGVAAWQHERADSAREQARRAEQRVDELAAVLAAPDARTVTARLDGGATGTVVVSRNRDRAVFVASGMRPPPEGRVYQLWYDDHGAMRSAGLMNPTRTTQAVLLRGGLDGASGVGVTVEPAGGSAEPTSAPVALLALP
ncbi:anti-sigma factor [Streptomyces sp. CL7]|uniref:anti-sigma factor n=1 Tax=Streptomyces sp. CL7 TaxID=3096006 RepID=UPI002A74CC5F|nr:anti-sigma factor [Streptomyces sp. CL7]WPP32972.1 anti-sigma factor [Streptomyces sp. CL7]